MLTLEVLTVVLRHSARARHPEATGIEVHVRPLDCLADIFWTDVDGTEHCEVVRYWLGGSGPIREEVKEVY